jgi:hypothetical protein
MAEVGHVATGPRLGAYCQLTLDTGEKVVVNHDHGGAKGGHLAIEVPKFMGFISDRIFACNLDSPHGQGVLAWLTRGAAPRSHARDSAGGDRRVREGCWISGRAEEMLRGSDGGPQGWTVRPSDRLTPVIFAEPWTLWSCSREGVDARYRLG